VRKTQKSKKKGVDAKTVEKRAGGNEYGVGKVGEVKKASRESILRGFDAFFILGGG